MKIMIINGPNLNLQGIREPEIYGTTTFSQLIGELQGKYPKVRLDYFQSNVEGELINCLHEKGFGYDGIIFNPGAYAHTSIAIGDAVASISTPVVEVHISNIASREDFRQRSYVGIHARGVIFGFGMQGYELALQSFLK